jgi:putative restriction endonuclease
MTPDEIRGRFNTITVWQRGGERAPHKPLLAIYAIARLLRGERRMIPYAEIDRELGKLLMEFGPRRQSYHPEYPFWRLQNDGLWEVSPTEGLTARRSNTDAKKSELLEQNVHGGFLPEIYDRLAQDKQLAREIVQDLLNANFPESIHQDILDAIGIEFAIETRIVIARSPDFRDRILRAYEYSCAICGFDM